VQAQDAAGTSAKIVNFDFSPEVVQAIKDKKIDFSVEQQPYLQGHLAVDSLWQLTNGNDIGGCKPTLTRRSSTPRTSRRSPETPRTTPADGQIGPARGRKPKTYPGCRPSTRQGA
jgi:ABC-type sugar transport system substrate-binding protein